MIFTSNPYALCHQLSKGADVIIITVPQMHTHAPKRPTEAPNFHRLPTRLSRSRAASECGLQHQPAAAHPETIAAICSSMCGYVQKVSRPTVRCQEMSQMRPTTIQTDEKSVVYSGQVDRRRLAVSRVADPRRGGDSRKCGSSHSAINPGGKDIEFEDAQA